ncbi:MAG: FtsW/RodA/SpoVE family cell cycle protein [Chloroflexi bacterium]|nr:FtsW/RodA/SpoVE family cell cycle protein [Chloroflexota bacterium]MBI3339587.1 FtsW/RodA/SpoVE family cell cycle protein [Chloroflexota bacterium]
MTDQREGRLLFVAAIFLFLYSIILTLSPAVRERTWDVAYRFSHWVGFVLWIGIVIVAHRITSRRLPDRDPYLLPLASLLGGWGMLTIWRLDAGFGLRQAIWLGVSIAGLTAIIFTPKNLGFLRSYKYILLTGGLGLTALTLLLGTNPAGFGPRLWLGCCGFYFQPSEPLKLLLVIYLAAYLADRLPIHQRIFPLLVPTVFVTGLALLLLLVQRDLGTASIFISLYAAILYLATGKRRALLAAAIALALAGSIGYFLIDIIRIRLDAWLNPWSDPSGHSYQIIQSLLAVANGGMLGLGPGLGSPGLVPVAHSDFIFAAIAEETGLAGTLGLLAIFGLILARGLIISLRAPDRFRRLLAAGLTAYLGIQALLIIGGNLRILPLTGVTLPFVSYGGSSLLTSFIALALLLAVSDQTEETEPASLTSPQHHYLLAALLGIGLFTASLAGLWWAVVRAPDLLTRTDNPRRSIADRYVLRGQLLDRNSQPIDITNGKSGSYQRVYLYPNLAPLVGYTQATYGQAGLEASLDNYLRGLQGYPVSTIWWNRLVYGTPPPGLDVRLSLDLQLQKKADQLLGEFKGAVILINAQTGEILVMASHPTYDPNRLNEIGSFLAQDKNTPLINRAAQGMYPPGTALTPFLSALQKNGVNDNPTTEIYKTLGFYSTPAVEMPQAAPAKVGELENLRVSPLQMAVAAASLSNSGMRPTPRIALAVNTPQDGWVVLHAFNQPTRIFSADIAKNAASQLSAQDQPYWEWTGFGGPNTEISTWYLGGTMPNWQGTPLTVVVLIEGNYPATAQAIGGQLLQTATNP